VRIFSTIYTILHKPFPEQESSFGSLRINLGFSAFVIFFLYVFRPFGISSIESNAFLICAGFGLMTFLAAIIYELIIGKVLKLKGELEHWTFGKWIIYNLGAMLVISLANFLFARTLIFGFIDWILLPHMIYGTFMVGIIPMSVLGGLSVLIQEKKYQNIATTINQETTPIPDSPKVEGKSLFGIPINRIKYVRALQNYVTIGHVTEEGRFKIVTQRTTIKNIEETTLGTSVVKVHRSFLVNRNAVVSISGNAQGLLLHLGDCDRTVPVSRSYITSIRGK
jgi:LytTr DNA-binding domain